MWDSLSPAWRACLEEAWDSYCAGSLPIGAVVADALGNIVSRGRNQLGDDAAAKTPGANGPVTKHDLAHAELNALLALSLGQWDKDLPNSPRQWTLYTTMEPCPLCLGAFYMSGLRQLCYAARDSYAGSVNLLGATPYLSAKPIMVTGPHALLEPLSAALVVETNLRETIGERTQGVLAHWRQTIPHSVGLGERLFEQQTLRLLRAAHATAAEMVVQVSRVAEQMAGKV